MRITQNAMMRNYLKSMNTTLGGLSASSDKLTTGRRFTKISEDVSSGVNALKTRQKLYKSIQIQDNLKAADEELEVAETNLMSIKEIADSIHEQSIKVQNGTNMGEHETFAKNFDNLNQQIMELANCTYNDKYVLGGTNNSENSPFTLNADGKVCFNGVEVNQISKENGIYMDDSGTTVPESGDIYMDIGLGLKFNGSDLNTNSAFKLSVSGLECIGYGTETVKRIGTDGVEKEYEIPNNLCETLAGMSAALRENDMEKFAVYESQFKKQTDTLVTNVSEIGVRTNFLESNLARMENEEFQLTEKQANLEGVEDTDELINYKALEYSYMLSLQYGGKVLPNSLMDFLR